MVIFLLLLEINMSYLVQNVSVLFWVQMREWKDCTSPTCNAQNRLLNDHYCALEHCHVWAQLSIVKAFSFVVILWWYCLNLRTSYCSICPVYPIGSMVLLYMLLHGSHQYTPFMFAAIYQHQPDPMAMLGFAHQLSARNWALIEAPVFLTT